MASWPTSGGLGLIKLLPSNINQEIQSLMGLLIFACMAVVPGRAFLCRLIDLTTGVQKPHFLIRLPKEMFQSKAYPRCAQ